MRTAPMPLPPTQTLYGAPLPGAATRGFAGPAEATDRPVHGPGYAPPAPFAPAYPEPYPPTYQQAYPAQAYPQAYPAQAYQARPSPLSPDASAPRSPLLIVAIVVFALFGTTLVGVTAVAAWLFVSGGASASTPPAAPTAPAAAPTAPARPSQPGKQPPRRQPAPAAAPSPRQLSDVTVYSASWCGACKVLKRDLASRNVPFTEVDVDDHPDDFRAAARASNSRGSIPLTRVAQGAGERWFVGADGGSIERAYKAR